MRVYNHRPVCCICRDMFMACRTDAKFCSASCRKSAQRHRERVTATIQTNRKTKPGQMVKRDMQQYRLALIGGEV
ncbi:MAG: hypothetical protein JKX85_00560 [Phycisphaeraceae bacterium]|nr:hypothetical protein [Phycisphaeraceae bacterium]